MVQLKSKEEIELLRESALIVSRTLGYIAEKVAPGVTPLELDKIAYDYIHDQGAVPGFLGFNGFPNSLCISKNEAVVHGIPDKTPLKEGDIVSVDCGAVKNGYYGDHAYTFAIGEIAPEIEKLLRITKESLYLGIEQMRVGNRIGDIGYAIQKHTEKEGYGVVRELVGHGLGKSMHEDPQVPNFGKPGRGPLLKEGMVLAIEPMLSSGSTHIRTLDDAWTVVTADRALSAHYEHTVLVTEGEPEILTPRERAFEPRSAAEIA